MDKSEIAQQLKELRNKRKLTQEEVANKLNIPRGTLADYENNGKIPLHSAVKIADFYNIDISYIFDFFRGLKLELSNMLDNAGTYKGVPLSDDDKTKINDFIKYLKKI